MLDYQLWTCYDETEPTWFRPAAGPVMVQVQWLSTRTRDFYYRGLAEERHRVRETTGVVTTQVVKTKAFRRITDAPMEAIPLLAGPA